MKIAYFVHDLGDPAAERRARMLMLGGAELTVLGFRRTPSDIPALGGAPAFDLGRTYDARMKQRAFASLRWMTKAGRLAPLVEGSDLILARNLEMLALAAAVRATLKGPKPDLIYECLDIHRLMLDPGAVGRALRAVERRLLRQSKALVVSSPAFLSGYFEPLQNLNGAGPRTLLVENKVLLDMPTPPPIRQGRAPARPWRIVWPGVIRCRKSLDMLKALAGRRPDLLEVVIRGRPTEAVFPNLAAELEGAAGIRFEGEFAPEEVPALYWNAHFTWAVDYYDEGKNSRWLLPNRLYDSGYYGSVPIVLRGVELGRWCAQHGVGVLLDDPERQLEAFLEQLTPEAYAQMEAAGAAAPIGLFAANLDTCHALVRDLAEPKTTALAA